MMEKCLFILCSLFSFADLAEAKSVESKVINVEMTVPPVRMESDIAYSLTYNNMGRPVQLSMDLLQPYSPKPLPTVLFITGGGFMDAPKAKFIGQRVDMARAGYVVASINYRVVPMVTFPGMLEDVKTAVRYLRANAGKFGIDPNRIAVMGESAGGYLAALMATTNGMREFDKGEYLDQQSDVQAAIDLYGLSDLTSVGDDFSDEIKEAHKSPAIPEAMLVHGIPWQGGGSILSDVAKAKKANPITYISKKTPPFLIMHGDADNVVSPSQTKILHEALLSQGVDSTRYIVKGADHAGFLWYQPEIMDIVIKFLDKNLKDKKSF
ncbi:Alpha/beta hydrolase fold-3 domain protein [Dickeya chrysanthemi Ech1591]|uniref:Alpha/beta hydrolase fold-3 domain protein n=1 Tax=Dickeya chrysanthemi (strain Ech1591) TaxID=561229 RepID=C6CNK3_DICC1|nr:alpha/beta hydrolase [Dickeya chrysanthemi]ACT05924.1 Alpha/beta hydrolase fold-3 domain protein [Dickeya chrysanthemi Ech1591]